MSTAASRRIAHDAAYVLHQYDWSESSLILELFTLAQGRITLVAKGAKKPTSNFRPVLLPMQRLELHYALPTEGEIGSLRSAEWIGGHTLPQGDALLAAYYCNELLLRLLPRQDAQPALFDAYATCIALLATLGKADAAGTHGTQTQLLAQALDSGILLRAWELLLLRQLGLLPDLTRSTAGHSLALADTALDYTLLPERGLRPSPAAQHSDALAAAHWLAIDQALGMPNPFTALVSALLALGPAQRSSLRRQLKTLLDWQLHSPLRTRQFMHDVQALA